MLLLCWLLAGRCDCLQVSMSPPAEKDLSDFHENGLDSHVLNLVDDGHMFRKGRWGMNPQLMACSETDLTTNFYSRGSVDGLHVRKTSGGNLDLQTCSFKNTQCNRQEPGGAVYFNLAAALSLWECSFENCRSGNGWGAAIFANCSEFSPKGGQNYNTFSNMNAQFSVVQVRKTSGVFEDMTIGRCQFRNLILHEGTVSDGDLQCGGSGLNLLYVKSLKFTECTFDTCESKSDYNRAAGALLLSPNADGTGTFTKIELSGCTFQNCKGKTGSIYIRGTVTNFQITTFGTNRPVKSKISGSGGSTEGHPYSVYASATAFTFKDFTMTGMTGGNGQIYLGSVTGKSTIENCVFSSWKTAALVKVQGDNYPEVTLKSTQFTGVTVSGQWLWKAGGKALEVTGCTFTDVILTGSLILGTGAGQCNIWGQTTIENVTPGSDAVLKFTGAPMTVRKVTFRGSGRAWNRGAISVSGKTAIIEECSFTNIKTTTAEGGEALVKVMTGTNCQSFKKCVFSDCDHSAAFIRIEVEVLDGGVQYCNFTNCKTNWACIKGTTNLQISKGHLDQVTVQNGQGTLPGWVSTDSGAVTISNFNFSRCSGNSVVYMGHAGDLTLMTCRFESCGSPNALIRLQQRVNNFYLEGICFVTTTNGLDIQGQQGQTVQAHLPLCFGRPRTESVNFGSDNPFATLESTRKIFQCDTCEEQQPADPTSAPEITTTEDTDITDVDIPTSEDTGDDTSNEPETSDITSEYPVEPTGGDSGAKQGGLDAGGIVGILIALLICVALLVIIIILLLRRRKKEKSDEPAEGEMTEETIDDTMSSFGSYDTANTEFTEDNPLFAQELELPESEFHNYEENWI